MQYVSAGSCPHKGDWKVLPAAARLDRQKPFRSHLPVVSILCLAVYLLVPKPLSAQEATPPGTDNPTPIARRLTLADAKRIAFEKNWGLLAAQSDVSAALAQQLIAHEFPNPTLSLSTTKINVDGHSSSTSQGSGVWERNYDTIAAINQLFEIGGKRSSRQASAKAGITGAKERLKNSQRILDQAVTKAYVNVLLARENVRILQESSNSLRHEASIAAVRLQAGDVSLADKSQIEIAADRLELDAESAKSAATNALISLDILLGTKSPTGDWEPGESLHTLARLPFLASNTPPGSSRPDLRAAEAAREKAEADLKLQKAMRLPDPTFLFQYEHEPADQPNTLGIGISFPLPLWNVNRGAIQSAQAAREQAALQVEQLRAQIVAEISTAQTSFADANKRFDRYQTQIAPRSAEIRNTVSFAYEKGGASLLDLLSAQRNDNDIRLATAQAAADLALAVADLTAALNLSPTLVTSK